MNKIYQLDPRHQHLLSDHTSGYWWIRPMRRSMKYRGLVQFFDDFGAQLERGVKRKVVARRLHTQLVKFKTHGYIFSGVEFIKLLDCHEVSLENIAMASAKKLQMVEDMKRLTRIEAAAKSNLRKYGPEYKGPQRIIRNRGSHGEQMVWIWSFENVELGKRYEHIFHFIDAGQQVGKSRRAFVDFFGLCYRSMQSLAAGKIRAHRGWTLIGEPRRMTRRQAIALKIKLLSE